MSKTQYKLLVLSSRRGSSVAKTGCRGSGFAAVCERERKEYPQHDGRLSAVYVAVRKEGEHDDEQKQIPIVVEHNYLSSRYAKQICLTQRGIAIDMLFEILKFFDKININS